MSKPVLLSLALAFYASAAMAEPGAAPAVDPARLAHHVSVLASDAYEGRQPGTPGERLTLSYISGQMRDAGLAPAAEGGWYQPVRLIAYVPKAASLTAVRTKRAIPASDLALAGPNPAVRLRRAPLVFAGYGLPSQLPQDGSLKGAVALYLPDAPKAGAPGRLPDGDARRKAMRAAGAAAAIAIVEDGSWEGNAQRFAPGLTRLGDQPLDMVRGIIRRFAAQSLAGDGRDGLDALTAEAAQPGFVARRIGGTVDLVTETEVRRFTSWNVAGLLPGATRPEETVLVTAHWDHLGICRPDGVPDRICNGAVDNASGVAGLIEMARMLAQGDRPDRSILFLATTAEEMGLLGARAYARRPLAPLGKTVAALNLDTIALRPAGSPVAVVGRGLSSIDPIVATAAAAQGRTVFSGNGPNAFIERSDAFAFVEAGVPAVIATGVLASPPGPNDGLLDGFFRDRYHKPSDEPGPQVDFSGAAEDVGLNVAIARRLGDSATNVEWLAASPYQRAGATH